MSTEIINAQNTNHSDYAEPTEIADRTDCIDCVNEDLTEEEEALEVPHITVRRKHLKNFLALSSRLPNQTKDHCPFIMLEVERRESADNEGYKQYYIVQAYASDASQVSTLKMEIPVLNTKDVFKEGRLVLKKSALMKVEKLSSGDNITLVIKEKPSNNSLPSYDAYAYVYGGLLPIPQGAFTKESFTFVSCQADGFTDVIPSETLNAIKALTSIAASQTKDPIGSLQFLEECAAVEDLGGYVRYDGSFFRHLMPKWAAESLQSLLQTMGPDKLEVGVVRDKATSFPCICYRSKAFQLTFTRFKAPVNTFAIHKLESGVMCPIDTLRNIARIPVEMKSEFYDYYDGTLTLSLSPRETADVFSVRFGGKGSDEYIIKGHGEFGELKTYPSAKIPSSLLFQFLDSCKDTGMVSISFTDRACVFSLGPWSCTINTICS